MELAMMGERCPAQKALEWGLVNEVHPDDVMLDVALEKARNLAAGPTQTLTLIRQVSTTGPCRLGRISSLRAWLHAATLAHASPAYLTPAMVDWAPIADVLG